MVYSVLLQPIRHTTHYNNDVASLLTLLSQVIATSQYSIHYPISTGTFGTPMDDPLTSQLKDQLCDHQL